MRKARGQIPARTPRRPRPPRSLRQHLSALLRQPVAAPAGVVTGGLLLVTTRHMPQSSMSYRVLAQVTTLRDVLFWRITSFVTTAQCGSSICPFLNGHRLTSRAARAPLSLGRWLISKDRLPTGSALDANATCRAGKQQRQRHKREWCPGSLVALAMLRHARRTVTLTRHASHTMAN